ncbi:helix-turn-helix transcriptional regulator [Paenibacillus sp. Marseille-Q4541]|uniref:helix-turn-helix domain-containing protein n=1 Tax=Paenibacillus sp. Marseille-Q4541 TaxID=2831522 RepID=UPI001BAA9CD2|nr:helix-turn-helix transcriptional regulator [Paenibacillus sp. Marseille-Q4541]
MSIGANIKEWRKIRGLTQLQLAEKTNLSRSYVADLERNRYNPSVETLEAFAKVLNIKISDLIESKNPDLHEESELADIPIEKLNQYTLTYKGHTLSKEEADDVIDLLEAALKRWKK